MAGNGPFLKKTIHVGSSFSSISSRGFSRKIRIFKQLDGLIMASANSLLAFLPIVVPIFEPNGLTIVWLEQNCHCTKQIFSFNLLCSHRSPVLIPC